MKTSIIAGASAIFCAAVLTELTFRLWPGNYLALLITATVLLFLSGMLNLKLAGTSTGTGPATAAKPRQRRERSDRDTGSKRKRRGNDRSPAGSSPPATGPREEGTVKWFNRSKGFGFIIRESGEEIFVHQRSILASEGDGRRRPNLRDGQKVSFVVSDREKGLQADDVEPLES